jgi:hypothetical protein
MYHAPAYVWLLTIIEISAFPLATSVLLFGGAQRAGLGRRKSALIAIASAVVFGSWFTASGVIAGHGEYHARLGHGLPLLPIVVTGFIVGLLALSRIPSVARALSAPTMVSRLIHPHSFRVGGLVFLLLMFQGHLPALFALPAGLGDIAIGIAAPRIARGIADGTGRRAALRFNAFGIADLVVAMIMGAVVGYQLIHVTPSGAPISELPLALIPSAAVPLLFALHIISISALRKSAERVRPTGTSVDATLEATTSR